MNEWTWRIINFCQVAFFFFWSSLWASVGILLRLITFRCKPALWIPNYFWAPALVGITRSKMKVEGLEHLDPQQPYIFAFNHQSTLDIAVVFVAIHRPLRFVAKKELLYIPLFGWYMWATGMIFVDRGKSQKAIDSLKRAGELIRNGADIAAFPEGTRSADGQIHPFKKGIFIVALEAGVPIVPVAIEGTRFIMPKNSFRLRPHDILVKIGTPIETKSYSYEERDLLMNEVRNQLIDLHTSIGGLGGEKIQLASTQDAEGDEEAVAAASSQSADSSRTTKAQPETPRPQDAASSSFSQSVKQ